MTMGWELASLVALRQRRRSHEGFCELFMFCNERGRSTVGVTLGPDLTPASVFYVHIRKGTEAVTKPQHRALQEHPPRRERTPSTQGEGWGGALPQKGSSGQSSDSAKELVPKKAAQDSDSAKELAWPPATTSGGIAGAMLTHDILQVPELLRAQPRCHHCQEHTSQTQRHPAKHQPPEESIHQETPEEMTTTTKTFPNSQNYTKKVRGEGTRKQLGMFISIFNLLLPKLPLTSTNNCGQATRGRTGQAGLHYLRTLGEG
ncbi:hypothetical protein Anapl_10355 [Anas platyrhynchos]|uniref:Uncharacterized protein n=1 Tax=Anas platyrhynchos TaxID=8839 RepID=R0JI54_ANAPL|nr:hypothetical protein Anapl_10355 [Anas platyrhynchos]